ncbi:hypothetical protein ACIQPP_05520 [Streptomyces violaceusniger]|uniref:hypothetical protein n=1 Tax=Streptomyces violaceusniger TaxID=68280 RepID=UPI000997A033|nr:hypothetical protein [Streptomyces hygroscopicus]AQW55280.1 hypothetical protein SHXM_08743 [Streptomyces hygroscopicus]
MRVRLTDGIREVDIRLEGSDPAMLRQAERTARRLLKAMHTEPTSSSSFGFGRHLDTNGIALDSTIERADPDAEPELGDENHEDGQT